MALGLYADSLFGLIAVINSYIGIRQELKAKATLDELAVLVAPHAKVVRDGETIELLATEVVPGDVVHVEPGDQLVADGEVIPTRGMTLDESMLTGEADGVRKGLGERALSGSFCVSGSGYYVADAVREESYAGRPRRGGSDLPPPPLAAAGRGQPGDRRLRLCDGAAGGDPPLHPEGAQRGPRRSGADRDGGPGDADPGGHGAADERHLRGGGRAAGPTGTPWSSR